MTWRQRFEDIYSNHPQSVTEKTSNYEAILKHDIMNYMIIILRIIQKRHNYSYY